MIVVLGQVEVDREDLESLERVIATMEKATRAEAGCLDYVFSEELSRPGHVRIFELWESMDALTAHFGTPHMQAFNEALAAKPPKSIHLKVHELGQEVALPGAGG